MVMTRTDKRGRMVWSGSHDYSRTSGSMTVELVGTDDNERNERGEVRFVGDSYYTQDTADTKTYWVVEKDEPIAYPNEAIVPLPGMHLDPKQALDLIMASGDKLEERPAKVRGVTTTHYRIEIDPNRLSANLPQGRRLAHGDPSQDRPFAVDVWADEAGRLRRLRIHEEMVEEDSATLTYEFFDFGVAVDIEPPPADQVISREKFDALTEALDEEMLELCMEELPRQECEQMQKENP